MDLRTHVNTPSVHLSRLLWLVIILILLLCVQGARKDKCPRRCVCATNKVYCDYIGLKNIPKHLPPNLQYLYLRDNNIRRVVADRLKGLHDMRHLLLKGNKIRHIDSKAFRDATMLVSLSLTDNNLRHIAASTFLPLSRLKVLSIRNNRLQDIEGIFTFLNKLQLVNLGGNRIKTITSRTFVGTPSMEILDLHNNHIRTISNDAFSDMPKLKFLVLRSNLLSQVEFLFSASLRGLELLDLSHNRLRHVPQGLPESIVDLRLSQNKIRELKKQDFANTTKIRLLVLTGNEIKQVEDGTFSSMSDLYDLYLVSNQLREIPRRLPRKIHGFYANFNNISAVREGTFANNNAMEFLYIRDNQIREIEALAFEGLHHLRGLDISRNRIKSMRSHTFSEMPQLELLDLSKNPLNLLQRNAFKGLRRLNILQMASVSPHAPLPKRLFEDLRRLRFLDISSSPELVDKLLAAPEQLIPLSHVEDLNLMNNQLKNIPSILPRLLRNVRLLKIVGNPWHCDTKIDTLWSWLRNRTATDFYGRSYLTCASPPQLKGQIVQDLHPTELPRPTLSPIYNIDEPGLVFTIINEGVDGDGVNIISDRGTIYHASPDEARRTDTRPSKVRVITEDGNSLQVDVRRQHQIEIENVNRFNRKDDGRGRHTRQRVDREQSKQLQYRQLEQNNARYPARQPLSSRQPTGTDIPDELSMELMDTGLAEPLANAEASGYMSGDNA